MRYLLDTCVLLWVLNNDKRKLGDFVPLIQDESNFIVISVVSYWEIVIKQSLGKIKVKGDLVNAVKDSGFTWMSLEIEHVEQLKTLPLIHHDPFDRLLISQSIASKFRLLTRDREILKYNLYQN